MHLTLRQLCKKVLILMSENEMSPVNFNFMFILPKQPRPKSADTIATICFARVTQPLSTIHATSKQNVNKTISNSHPNSKIQTSFNAKNHHHN